ncbi:hypothetical protein DNTS_015808, partial [Danionella cerebrum]
SKHDPCQICPDGTLENNVFVLRLAVVQTCPRLTRPRIARVSHAECLLLARMNGLMPARWLWLHDMRKSGNEWEDLSCGVFIHILEKRDHSKKLLILLQTCHMLQGHRVRECAGEEGGVECHLADGLAMEADLALSAGLSAPWTLGQRNAPGRRPAPAANSGSGSVELPEADRALRREWEQMLEVPEHGVSDDYYWPPQNMSQNKDVELLQALVHRSLEGALLDQVSLDEAPEVFAVHAQVGEREGVDGRLQRKLVP